MKKFNASFWSFLFCAVAVGVWFWSSSASAALNVYEPFNYSTGALQDQVDNSGVGTANGNTWLRAGTANPPSNINVASGNLTGPAELPPAIGNELTITGIGNGSAPQIVWHLASSTRAAPCTTRSCWTSLI